MDRVKALPSGSIKCIGFASRKSVLQPLNYPISHDFMHLVEKGHFSTGPR